MQGEAPGTGRLRDGPGERVFAVLLQTCGSQKQIFLGVAAGGDHLDQFGTAFGEGARLIDRQCIDPLESFEHLGILD